MWEGRTISGLPVTAFFTASRIPILLLLLPLCLSRKS